MRKRYFIGIDEVSEVRFNYFIREFKDILTKVEFDYPDYHHHFTSYKNLNNQTECFCVELGGN